MHTNDVVAERVLGRELCGALPLPELMRRVSGANRSHTGGAEILLREVESRPEAFRVLYPCVGPWLALAPRGSSVVSVDPWVLVRAPATTLEPTRTEAMLSETLRQVGAHVDADSFTALARWLQLVMAAGQVRQALHSLAMNHPVRHSSSASESTSEKPALAAAA